MIIGVVKLSNMCFNSFLTVLLYKKFSFFSKRMILYLIEFIVILLRSNIILLFERAFCFPLHHILQSEGRQ